MLESSPGRLRFRIRKGDFEVELEGEENYVKRHYERLLSEHSAGIKEPTSEIVKQEPKTGIPETPKTMSDKLGLLKEQGFFKEPKESGGVTKELRDRGWGVYLSKDVSSALKRTGTKLGLRRVPLGKGRYAYTYP